jgi:hypothetical protein
MARTNATDVKLIMDNVTLSDAIVNSYISAANTMLNEVLGTTESDLMTEIERWLTAHMITITRERQAAKEGAGGAEITYTGKWGWGLQSSSYGQMVLALDTSGAFGNLEKRPASIYAVPQYDVSDEY